MCNGCKVTVSILPLRIVHSNVDMFYFREMRKTVTLFNEIYLIRKGKISLIPDVSHYDVRFVLSGKGTSFFHKG